jgi:hypothetical protein
LKSLSALISEEDDSVSTDEKTMMKEVDNSTDRRFEQ